MPAPPDHSRGRSVGGRVVNVSSGEGEVPDGYGDGRREDEGALRDAWHLRPAGADPGPACYGKGGSEPTVTDAAAILGMFGDGVLSESLTLDISGATRAMRPRSSPWKRPVRRPRPQACIMTS